VFNRRELGDAGVDDKDVDLSEALAGLIELLIEVGKFAHVALHRQHVVSEGGGRLIEGLPVAPEDCDLGVVGRELPRRREANPAVPAGDHRDLVQQLHGGLSMAQTQTVRLGTRPYGVRNF
jgi:hypothetical protein